jgi:hypothetical protein
MPSDPKRVDANSGYAYLTNAEGTVYKLVAFRTVEELSAIDEDDTQTRLSDRLGDFRLCNYVNVSALGEYRFCSGTADEFGSAGQYTNYPNCRWDRAEVQRSYALWGGFAGGINPGDAGKRFSRQQTEQVMCIEPS